MPERLFEGTNEIGMKNLPAIRLLPSDAWCMTGMLAISRELVLIARLESRIVMDSSSVPVEAPSLEI